MAQPPTSGRSQKAGAKRNLSGLLLTAVIVAAIGGVLWTVLEPRAERDDPNVVVNLTTRVGQQAPPFTLANSEGVTRTIAPGDGRKYVVIFHMGSI